VELPHLIVASKSHDPDVRRVLDGMSRSLDHQSGFLAPACPPSIWHTVDSTYRNVAVRNIAVSTGATEGSELAGGYRRARALAAAVRAVVPTAERWYDAKKVGRGD
jgi:hypothetical protein